MLQVSCSEVVEPGFESLAGRVSSVASISLAALTQGLGISAQPCMQVCRRFAKTALYPKAILPKEISKQPEWPLSQFLKTEVWSLLKGELKLCPTKL